MAQFPNFIRGRDLLFCYIAPVTVNYDGTFEIPSYYGVPGYNMAGYIKYVRSAVSPVLEMVQSLDVTVSNYVLTIDDFTQSFGEIIRNWNTSQGSVPLLLESILSGDNFICQYAVRSTVLGNATTVTILGVRGDMNYGVQNFGGNDSDLIVRPTTWTDMENNPITAGNVSGITSPFWVSQTNV